MIGILLGIFAILHGLVHLLYLGQSARVFELQPGMVWPDGAWTFSRLIGSEATRALTSVLLVGAAIGFVASGAGLLLKQDWSRPLIIGTAIFSTILYFVVWDGTFRHLDNQGWVGILINVALVVTVLIWKGASS